VVQPTKKPRSTHESLGSSEGKETPNFYQVSGIGAHRSSMLFTTPFSMEVMNDILEKVKISILELYDGATDSKERLEVCKT